MRRESLAQTAALRECLVLWEEIADWQLKKTLVRDENRLKIRIYAPEIWQQPREGRLFQKFQFGVLRKD